ncbi:hypothetical protein ThvES_00019600 [Thiovulum sp. ES]|nr:hypothetical protein ThvES_00019600 [Thiovulum sp. ES]
MGLNLDIQYEFQISQGESFALDINLKDSFGQVKELDTGWKCRYVLKSTNTLSSSDTKAYFHNVVPVTGSKICIDIPPEVTYKIPVSKKPYILSIKIHNKSLQLSKEFYFYLSITQSVVNSLY